MYAAEVSRPDLNLTLRPWTERKKGKCQNKRNVDSNQERLGVFTKKLKHGVIDICVDAGQRSLRVYLQISLSLQKHD